MLLDKSMSKFKWGQGPEILDEQGKPTGERGQYTPRTAAPTEEGRLKQKFVVEKRKEGYTWEQIGQMMRPERPLSAPHVREMYKKAMKAIIAPATEELRQLEQARMDSMLVELNRMFRRTYWLVNQGSVVRDVVEDEQGQPIVDAVTGLPLTTRLEDVSPKLGIMDRMMKIMDRRAKLMGLDIPVRREITGENGGPIALTNLNLTGLSDEDLATVISILSKTEQDVSPEAAS